MSKWTTDRTEARQYADELKKRREDQERVLLEVGLERRYQDDLWGGPSYDDQHSSHDWIAYVVHQLGQCQMEPFDLREYRKRMVKVAALAVASIEWCDRLAALQSEERRGT